MIPPRQQLDSRVRIATPENIAFEYQAAGPFARIGAYLVDLLILTGLYLLAWMAFLAIAAAFGMPGAGALVLFTSLFVAFWFYGGFFEVVWSGQTPGKRALGLRSLRTDGRPLTPGQAILRNLLRFIDLFPYASIPGFFGEEAALVFPTALVGLVAMACTKRYQRLGDLACGTMVVVEEPTTGAGRAHDAIVARDGSTPPELRAMLDVLPAGYQPSRSLTRALSHYCGRRRYFGPGRRHDIAKHVAEPLAEKLGLPPGTDYDLLLCALYARTFLADSDAAAEESVAARDEPAASADGYQLSAADAGAETAAGSPT